MRRNQTRPPWPLRKKVAISALLIGVGCILCVNSLKSQIAENLDAVSRIRAEGVINELIHETIEEEFSRIDSAESLFKVQRGTDGQVQMVQADTQLITQIVSNFASALQEKYDAMEPRSIKLSYGSLLGSRLLSQAGLGLSMRVLPMAVTRCDYETEFEGQAINQTKYKIYIVQTSNVRVLVPFSAETMEFTSKLLVCEVVIVGDVPDSYVNVPKEDILDVT